MENNPRHSEEGGKSTSQSRYHLSEHTASRCLGYSADWYQASLEHQHVNVNGGRFENEERPLYVISSLGSSVHQTQLIDHVPI
jgi:hypothetical protein